MTTNKNFSKKIFLFLIIGLLIRLFFSYFQYSGDVKNHYVWASSFLTGGFGFFNRHFPGFNDPNYPPLAIILFSFFQYLHQFTLGIFIFLNDKFSFFPSLLLPLWESENLSFLFLKIPGIIADIGIYLLIYKLSLLNKSKYPVAIAALYLFNPATIYLSSVWGQIEPVVNLFLLWSIYNVYRDGSPKSKILSIIFFTLAVLTKQTALWFLPFYLVLWVKEMKFADLLKGVLLSTSTFFVAYLPFGLWPAQAIKSYLSTLNGSSTLVSDAAWNIWFIFFGRETDDSTSIGFLSIRTFSIICLLVLLILLLTYVLRNYSKQKLILGLLTWSVLVFFLQTRVHERHLAPALVFNLSLYNFSPYGIISYSLLSVYHLYNLIYSLGLPFI